MVRCNRCPIRDECGAHPVLVPAAGAKGEVRKGEVKRRLCPLLVVLSNLNREVSVSTRHQPREPVGS